MMPEGVQDRAEQVRALVRGVLGEELLAVTHQDFGHRSLTFDVALAERSIIVRTNAAAGAFAGTAHNLTILAGLDLPVPRVLAADLTEGCFPFGWMVLEKIPGRKIGGHTPSHHAICGMVLFTPAPHPLPPHHPHTAPPRLPPPVSSPGCQERRQNPACVGGIEGKSPQVHMEPARMEYVHVGPADPEKGQS